MITNIQTYKNDKTHNKMTLTLTKIKMTTEKKKKKKFMKYII